jgi:hypothetical protein
VFRGLANDLRSPSAATDCAVCLEEFAIATRKSVASGSARQRGMEGSENPTLH